MIPASITITGNSGTVRSVVFTIIAATWSLYYKEISTGNKRVEFIDGTVFTVGTDGKLTVAMCPRGLDGTYTKSTDTSGVVVYKTATAATDIKKVVSCNWEKRVFSIGVESGTIDCGDRTYVGTSSGPTLIGVHAATEKDSANKQPSARFAFTNTAELVCDAATSFHPFAASVTPLLTSGTSLYNDAEIACHINSVQGSIARRFSCEKQRWRDASGPDILECTPGPKQKFINVSGFTRAETIFNGAYEYSTSRSSGNEWPVWKHKTNDKIRIEVSKTEANKLELRDSSSAVWYTIKIVPSPGSNPTLDVLTNTKPPFVSLSSQISPTSSIITAVFSDTDTGLSPCDLWSQCVEESSMKDGALANGVLTCQDRARRCAAASSNPELTSIELRLSSVATAGIKLYPMVKGDGKGALYGRDPGTSTGSSDTTTLYVVVPDSKPMDGQKGKVLVIPQAAADATVRDATLVTATSKSTWIIDAQAASVTDKPASVTDKPASVTDKPVSVTDKPASVTDKPASVTDKPVSVTDKPASVTDAPVPCGDLVSCATTKTSLEFSSCAAAAIECAPKQPQGAVSTHTLNHDDKKDIKLFPMGTDVLYGTDADNAYVVLVPKERVLVAPLDKKTDAVVRGVDKKGTVWTSKRDNTMMWIIGGVAIGALFIIILVGIWLSTRSAPRRRGYRSLRYAAPEVPYSYSVQYPPAPTTIQYSPAPTSAVPTTTTTTTTPSPATPP
jgi:hypothetical protein